MGVKLGNNAVSLLAASITDDATTISIQGADAGKFPALVAGDWTPATIIDAANNMEIVKITARAGAVLTVERAQEGTTAKAFPAGARIDVRITAGAFAALADRDGLKEVAYTGSYNDLIDTPPGTTTATVGAAVAAANGKTTPADGDTFTGVLSGTSTMFRTTWGNIKAALTALFDGRYLKLAGGALTGNLTIQKTYPLIEYRGTGTDKWWGYYDTGDGQFKLSYNEGVRFQVNTGGAVWTAQLGDLNTRIEDRAAAHADSRAWAVANDRVANLNTRWVSRGEFNLSYNIWREAPAGSAVTGFYIESNNWMKHFCYRYFQLFDPVRGWITAHNA
ncbi:hypothetical protein AGR7C_Cc150080 [Agrobacterium deltaense Zutra 3/1]|uniref:Uncharacterized protein n=1 Tax=Agrobacterium deltaense Zutra 3/1 TaxID=1183427 RepID=A0A1S7PER5_9HYPH|nr:hypothetical protein [Agrobacterium deltaense]CUX20334.1 hypothetical protein AGR7C_Cc150080 [Agrobacterium deltaense Zutra 3/1]